MKPQSRENRILSDESPSAVFFLEKKRINLVSSFVEKMKFFLFFLIQSELRFSFQELRREANDHIVGPQISIYI
jgi:hypothetical protein